MKFYKYRFGFIALLIMTVSPAITVYAGSASTSKSFFTQSTQFDAKTLQAISFAARANYNFTAQKRDLTADRQPKTLVTQIFEDQERSRAFRNLQLYACEQNTTVGIGAGAINLGFTKWRNELYLSVSLGPSVRDSIYYTSGKCKPLTGFFVNGSAGIGEGISVTWYPGHNPTTDKIISSPTLGMSAGITFKVSRELWAN